PYLADRILSPTPLASACSIAARCGWVATSEGRPRLGRGTDNGGLSAFLLTPAPPAPAARSGRAPASCRRPRTARPAARRPGRPPGAAPRAQTSPPGLRRASAAPPPPAAPARRRRCARAPGRPASPRGARTAPAL